MKLLHLTAASLLLSSSMFANDSLDTSIKNGTVSGDITLYGEKQNNSNATDSGFTSGSIGLSYETADFNGFKASVGFRGNHDFSEVEDGDYGTEDTKALVHTANISYANDIGNITIGRQEIDLEWMGDFHEAAVVGITAVPDTSITLGFTQRIATADADAELESFDKVNGDKGAYVLDVKYEGVEGLVLNPYYYKAEDVANWYGLKADYDTEVFGLTGHIAQSSEDTSSNDGQIMHLEARTSIEGLGLNAGYITTDKDAGIGSMDTTGDNINSLEEGNQVYVADADTTYLGLSYELAGVELGSIYGQTKYAQDKEKELNITADYGITDNLSTGLLFVDVDAQGNADYNKLTATVEYSF
jgi:hypothetical protein